MASACCLYLILLMNSSEGFLLLPANRRTGRYVPTWRNKPSNENCDKKASLSPTKLNVWWFGGTEERETVDDNADSCELVAVRIEATSPNSRRIAGEITVPTKLMDVWNILTDYNNLSTHVPNLVESRIINRQRGDPGDGSFECRLYQKGAQKIIGFEFGASVTMAMTEKAFANAHNVMQQNSPNRIFNVTQERAIGFRCVESPFFSEFDGEWRLVEIMGENGQPETLVKYVVDVRPRGPVPVIALEWRIREDVPTNLRAVKRASMLVAMRQLNDARMRGYEEKGPFSTQATANGARRLQPVPMRVKVDWDRDETMAAYLKD